MMRITALFFFAGLVGCSAYVKLPMTMRSNSEILRPFKEGRALKIIAGITNFDADSVEKVARVSASGGATHLDVACDPKLVKIAQAVAPRVHVVVSAIDPESFAPCVEAGADMLELGNFDAFYHTGLRLTSGDIVDLTKKTQSLYPRMPLSVTIPHVLDLDEQAKLAMALQDMGVDVIQTEGAPSIETMSTGVQALIERASPALAATYTLAKAATRTHIMASSGNDKLSMSVTSMSEVTAPMALLAGARGVGVGSAITKLKTEAEMSTRIRLISRAMQQNKILLAAVENKKDQV